MNDSFQEKRLVYDNWEDIYFISYNILLILYHLGCIDEKSEFKDYRKLIFLIKIISDDRKTNIVRDYYKGVNKANSNIRKTISELYFNSINSIIILRYVIIILEKMELLQITSENKRTNIYLVNFEKHKDFLENEKFCKEINNINILNKNIYRLRTLNYVTFVTNMFKSNEVAVWES